MFSFKRIAMPVAVSVGVVVMTACNSSTVASKVTTQSAVASSASADTAAPAATSPEAESDEAQASMAANGAEADDGGSGTTLLKFGQTYKDSNGWSVTVAKPVQYQPSEYAAGTDGFKHFVKVSFTLKNTTTDQAIDPSALSVRATVGDHEQDGVFDDNVGDTPSAKILPGRSVTFAQAYGYTPGQHLTIEIDDLSDFTGDNSIIYDGVVR